MTAIASPWMMYVTSPTAAVTLPRVKQQGRYAFIDGLRGVAALAVLLYHFGQCDTLIAYTRFASGFVLLNYGRLGVEVFFVLSGFVMAHSLRNAEPTLGYIGRFFVKRSLRLDPAYFIAVGLMFVIGARASGTAVAANLFYLQGVFHIDSILPPAWTLCYEIQFYAVLMFIMVIAAKFKRQWIAPAVIFALGIASLKLFSSREVTNHRWFVNLWFQFALGSLAYVAVRQRKPAWFVSFAVLVSLALFTANRMFHDSILATLFTSSLIVAAGQGDGLYDWLSGPVWQFLGRTSYGIYLVHWPVCMYVARLPASTAPLWPVFATGITLLLAWSLHRWVEMPGIELGKRLTSRSQSPDRPVAALSVSQPHRQALR